MMYCKARQCRVEIDDGAIWCLLTKKLIYLCLLVAYVYTQLHKKKSSAACLLGVCPGGCVCFFKDDLTELNGPRD